ncbi:MAG: fumarylacetoacetate hydrolase family protein [Saprospiraceae bacterium]|nr:fumarylacetoacetate hydrolase family protein [Saprospiraceae bacterium]
MLLYHTSNGPVAEINGKYYQAGSQNWDEYLNDDSLFEKLSALEKEENLTTFDEGSILKPIQSQELWACGVTYLRSKVGRQEESKASGGADFYGRVYEAERPEVFFKATAPRVVGTNQNVRIRRDSVWDVPEPELTLCVSSSGKIIGYTIGNDMSSRSIEGENPLYLPQAKTYDKCAALGPGIMVLDKPIDPDTQISLEIIRDNAVVFYGDIQINQLKRTLPELVGFVFREASFPHGCFIMTGTGIVPSSDFTLEEGDKINISIQGIGTLVNFVEKKPL